MPLGKEVGLGPGHIMLDGDQVGTQPPQQPLPTFGPCVLWPNGRPSQQLLSSCFLSRSLEIVFPSLEMPCPGNEIGLVISWERITISRYSREQNNYFVGTK